MAGLSGGGVSLVYNLRLHPVRLTLFSLFLQGRSTRTRMHCVQPMVGLILKFLTLLSSLLCLKKLTAPRLNTATVECQLTVGGGREGEKNGREGLFTHTHTHRDTDSDSCVCVCVCVCVYGVCERGCACVYVCVHALWTQRPRRVSRSCV